MSEDEAEAVLLALNGPLVWQGPDKEGAWQSDFVSEEVLEWYVIETHLGGPDVLYQPSIEGYFRDTEFSSSTEDSFEEAKAACERHHATGSWE